MRFGAQSQEKPTLSPLGEVSRVLMVTDTRCELQNPPLSPPSGLPSALRLGLRLRLEESLRVEDLGKGGRWSETRARPGFKNPPISPLSKGGRWRGRTPGVAGRLAVSESVLHSQRSGRQVESPAGLLLTRRGLT